MLHAAPGGHEHAVLHGGPVAEVHKVSGGDNTAASLGTHLGRSHDG